MRCLKAIGSLPVGSPSNRISPDVVPIRPVIIFMVVDLPDPFGPRYPVISPARASKTHMVHGHHAGEAFGDVAQFEFHHFHAPAAPGNKPRHERSKRSQRRLPW